MNFSKFSVIFDQSANRRGEKDSWEGESSFVLLLIESLSLFLSLSIYDLVWSGVVTDWSWWWEICFVLLSFYQLEQNTNLFIIFDS